MFKRIQTSMKIIQLSPGYPSLVGKTVELISILELTIFWKRQQFLLEKKTIDHVTYNCSISKWQRKGWEPCLQSLNPVLFLLCHIVSFSQHNFCQPPLIFPPVEKPIWFHPSFPLSLLSLLLSTQMVRLGSWGSVLLFPESCYFCFPSCFRKGGSKWLWKYIFTYNLVLLS